MIKKTELNLKEEELQKVLRNVNKIEKDSEEYIEQLLNNGRNIDEDMDHSFKVFDRDGDGLISKDEFQDTMDSLGEPMSADEVNAMIAQADLDKDGKLNFNEFQLLLESKSFRRAFLTLSTKTNLMLIDKFYN